MSADGGRSAYVEQGIRVFQIDDYSWYAAVDFAQAVTAALADWGLPADWGLRDPDAGARLQEAGLASCDLDRLQEADPAPCHLDIMTVNMNEDEDWEKGPILPARLALRQMIERGVAFPAFFAGTEG